MKTDGGLMQRLLEAGEDLLVFTQPGQPVALAETTRGSRRLTYGYWI